MPYRIVVYETKNEPVTKEDYHRIADSGNEKDGGAIYGFVAHDVYTDIKSKIYEQTVTELSISEIAATVNKL